MRSITSSLTVVLVSFSFLAFNACDGATDEPVVGNDELALVVAAEPTVEPMCRAAAHEGAEALANVLGGAAACEVDSDCTITVTDTRCTGEVVVAVGVDAEESFLLLADKVDARHCAEVPASCSPEAASDAVALQAVCVANVCQIAE